MALYTTLHGDPVMDTAEKLHQSVRTPLHVRGDVHAEKGMALNVPATAAVTGHDAGDAGESGQRGRKPIVRETEPGFSIWSLEGAVLVFLGSWILMMIGIVYGVDPLELILDLIGFKLKP